MFVRFLTGRQKGEIAEMRYADALPLLHDGRAERAFKDDLISGVPQPERVDAKARHTLPDLQKAPARKAKKK
ncbi:MAG: hypothetical protein ACLP1Y_09425 [Candidatus Acidiferrales bacterium]